MIARLTPIFSQLLIEAQITHTEELPMKSFARLTIVSLITELPPYKYTSYG
ncbi:MULTISPECIES: hypothetical protein [unclassified Microcystis]|uniref:hypothetical protein n=1 Tax=unclassified Microcystis TaxID=2643300 RepID=UPI0022BE9488|nr:hypothetical protein [Microcystis sp. M179S2]MCZ8121452.1 hypothetical protein [Microcystis sp. LE18-22.4A]